MIDELEEELADIRKKAEADLAAEKRETEIEKKRADAAEKENERLRKDRIYGIYGQAQMLYVPYNRKPQG